jgi:formamidopyrimidine-DNA glycosylase
MDCEGAPPSRRLSRRRARRPPGSETLPGQPARPPAVRNLKTKPELPEVELFARYFARHALGQRVARVRVLDERILGEIRKDAFVRKLRGRTFANVRRHGKHLFADAGGPWLHLHFGMSGDLAYLRDEEAPRFARVMFDFDNGARLAFEDMRLFGVADLVDDPDAFIRDKGLGPDPLDPQLTAKQFAALVDRRAAIKSVLMSQEIVAGLGNLYVDEILYQTGIAPRRIANRVRKPAEMFAAMQRILRTAIEGDLPHDALIHHREEGERCPRCGGTLRRSVVFGRTTYFCAKHQR